MNTIYVEDIIEHSENCKDPHDSFFLVCWDSQSALKEDKLWIQFTVIKFAKKI